MRQPIHAHLPERLPGEDAGPVVGEGNIDLVVHVCPCRCTEDPF